MATILDRIVQTKQKEVAAARNAVPLETLVANAEKAAAPRDFYAALAAPSPNGIHLIAEVKKASPSAGLIRADFDPVDIARQYQQAGASALSVLTDQTYFHGRLDHIDQIKANVPLPVLRKDFIIDEYQVYESRCFGADAVLLIAEVLGADRLTHLADRVHQLGMTALIEVHQQDLLAAVVRVVDLAPRWRRLLGFNNRDLTVQRTDIATTGRLAAGLTTRPVIVSESGIKTRADVERLVADGADAILVGETLLRSNDIVAKARELLGNPA
ncbi:MAG TPA: indole-3-glycerol phosphate synthase TrpC [Phycisphaerae bacterium]|nr:indole-3-glycerol phosphate synthase TrpC [Phycisphaerae bacterium]